MIGSPEDNKHLVEHWIHESNQNSSKRIRKYSFYTIIPIGIGILWMAFSFLQVRNLDTKLHAVEESLIAGKKELGKYRDSVATEKKNLELLKYLQTQYQFKYLQYLQQRGNKPVDSYSLQQSMQANTALQRLLASHGIDTSLRVQYFRKNLDAERVWLALKELDYVNVEDKRPTDRDLLAAETDALYFGKGVELFDIQVISLVLIRSGFAIKRIELNDKPTLSHTVQIGSYLLKKPQTTVYAPSNKPALSVSAIANAHTITQIIY